MKKKFGKKKEYFRFSSDHTFFFVALTINYIWRFVDDFMFNSFHSFWNFAKEVKPEYLSDGLKWWPEGLGSKLLGWTPQTFMSVLVWVISLYSLYLLYINIKEKKQVVASTIILIFGVLFYALTVFY